MGKAWEDENNTSGEEEIDDLTESKKNKNNNQENMAKRKRRKFENDEGLVWGETVCEGAIKREAFLKSGREATSGQPHQQKLKVLTGVKWMAHNLVMEIVGLAAQVVLDTSLMAEWEEWSEVESHTPPSIPAGIVEHGQGVKGVDKLPLPPKNTGAEKKLNPTHPPPSLLA